MIVHCAAWTAVDAAENEENKAKVDVINHLGTQYIVEIAKAVDAKMVYVSTDYVFDGRGERPWKPDDKCYAPLSVYGQSKLDGELEVSSNLEKYFIVCIAWISWAELAEESYKIASMDVNVVRVTTEEYGLTKTARPANSRMDKSKLVEAGFESLPDWKDAVQRYIKEAQL